MTAPATLNTGNRAPHHGPAAGEGPRPGLVAVIEGPQADESRQWSLPHHERAATTARDVTRHTLRAWGLDDDCVDRTLLVVSELVTNAVEHALPPVTLHLEMPENDAVVSVAVDDGGASQEPGDWVASCAPDEHGRGSLIVTALASDHGVTPGPGHATHWAELPIAA
ncbi:ATP-binding protein [Kitasatospora sp. NPDC048540]|uniref:ATP-binding protein n=1 Tax=unclassified Kitasatospora TaxID=2633591 RepID=UPI0009EC777F|nr:ATP-binding protein [Kitasatospora sp. MBT63]